MPCNLAVSITKAAVSEERLAALLTPEVVKLLMDAAFSGQAATIRQSGACVYVSVDGVVVSVVQGKIVGSGNRWDRSTIARLTDQIQAALEQGANALFARQVADALTALGTVQSQAVQVENDGVMQPATILTFRL